VCQVLVAEGLEASPLVPVAALAAYSSLPIMLCFTVMGENDTLKTEIRCNVLKQTPLTIYIKPFLHTDNTATKFFSPTPKKLVEQKWKRRNFSWDYYRIIIL
jgi:hypothetical protein